MHLRNILIATSIILAFAFSTKAQSSAQEVSESPKDTLTFAVYGMDCPGCEGSLEKQVGKIDAIKNTKANWVDQKLKIILYPDSSLTIDLLEKRVKKANFTLDKKAIKNEN